MTGRARRQQRRRARAQRRRLEAWYMRPAFDARAYGAAWEVFRDLIAARERAFKAMLTGPTWLVHYPGRV